MIAFALILFIVLPPAVWLLGYVTIDPGEGTKAEARKSFRHTLWRSEHFWMWMIYIVFMVTVFSGLATTIVRSIDLYLHGG